MKLGTHCGPSQVHRRCHSLANVGPFKLIDGAIWATAVGPFNNIEGVIRRRMWPHSKISTVKFGPHCGPSQDHRWCNSPVNVGPFKLIDSAIWATAAGPFKTIDSAIRRRMWAHSRISAVKFGHSLWAQPRPSIAQSAGECGPIQTYRQRNLGNRCGPIQ